MYNNILTLIKFNNLGMQHLYEPRRLFHSFCCATRCIFEPLCVYELVFNTDKYGIFQTLYMYDVKFWLGKSMNIIMVSHSIVFPSNCVEMCWFIKFILVCFQFIAIFLCQSSSVCDSAWDIRAYGHKIHSFMLMHLSYV